MEDDDFDVPLKEARRRKRNRQLKDEEVVEMRLAMADELDKKGRVVKRGLPVAKVAELFNVKYFTAYLIRRGATYKKAGGPILEDTVRKPPMSKAKKARVKDLKAKGATVDQLAKATGYGRTAIKKALSEPDE